MSARRELGDGVLGVIRQGLHRFELQLPADVLKRSKALRVTGRRSVHCEEHIVRQQDALAQPLNALQPGSTVVVDAHRFGLVQVERLDDLGDRHSTFLHEREPDVD
ncbi:MAG: hypothetical protein ACK559_24260, partial [bacterium]